MPIGSRGGSIPNRPAIPCLTSPMEDSYLLSLSYRLPLISPPRMESCADDIKGIFVLKAPHEV